MTVSNELLKKADAASGKESDYYMKWAEATSRVEQAVALGRIADALEALLTIVKAESSK